MRLMEEGGVLGRVPYGFDDFGRLDFLLTF